MILSIKTDQPQAELYLCTQVAKVDEIIWLAHRELADTIHLRINEMLQKNSIDFKDLAGIIVFSGPGSFTGLRIGITVANTFAYALNIPIVGTNGDNWLNSGLQRLHKNESDKIVLPNYGSEPNITKPKK